MKIRILIQSKCLKEVDLPKTGERLIVGRGSDCDIVIREDQGVSGEHFAITRERRGLRVEDLGSRNKLRFRDKVTEAVLLRPGQCLEFSRCTLEVSRSSGTTPGLTDSQNGYFIIESGQGKGRQFPIRETMVIGQTEGDDMLTLPDRRISRRHAKVRFQGGQGIWIDDLSSRNGTLVNGSRLEPGRERLLKDGDRVFIGGTVLEFVDGQRRSPLHVVPKAFAMVLTLLIVFGLYQGYQHIRPPASGFIEQAKSLAKAGQFEVALLSLDEAIHAREYNHHRNEVTTLRQQFRVSKGFLPLWQKTRERLEAKDGEQWDRAYPALVTLQETRADDLIWVEGHQEILALAGEYKDGIDAIKEGQHALSRLASQPDLDVRSILDSLAERKSTAVTNTAALARMRMMAGALHAQLDGVHAAVARLNEFGASFDEETGETPDFGKMARELGALKLPRGEWSDRRSRLIRALKLLEKGHADLSRAKGFARSMRLEDAIQHPVGLPSAREVSVHDRLKQWRSELEKDVESFRAGLLSVRTAVEACDLLAEKGRSAWTQMEGERYQEALECRGLLGAFPDRRRDVPHDAYDEVFGLRGFWAYMQSGTDEILAFNDPQTPALEHAARWFESLHVLEMKMRRVPVLGEGKAGAYLKAIRGQLARKDNFIETLLEDVPEEATATRQAILKAGTAMRLVKANPEAVDQAVSIRTWLDASINEHELFLRDRDAEFDPFSNQGPGKTILREGIPGCRYVQKMWVRSI